MYKTNHLQELNKENEDKIDWNCSKHSKEITCYKCSTTPEAPEQIITDTRRIGMLRQYLNEDRITDPKKMITNDIIKQWLK